MHVGPRLLKLTPELHSSGESLLVTRHPVPYTYTYLICISKTSWILQSPHVLVWMNVIDLAAGGLTACPIDLDTTVLTSNRWFTD